MRFHSCDSWGASILGPESDREVNVEEDESRMPAMSGLETAEIPCKVSFSRE